MSTSKHLMFCLVVFAASFTLSTCHFMDDTDTIEDGVELCPLNSAYPCPCNALQQGEHCDDGSLCLFHTDPERGFCSPVCSNTTDDSTECIDNYQMVTTSYGLESMPAMCIQDIDLAWNPQCLLICGLDGETADCPPGFTCNIREADGDNDPNTGFKACLPVPRSPPDAQQKKIAKNCSTYCNITEACVTRTEGTTEQTESAETCVIRCHSEEWVRDNCGNCYLECVSKYEQKIDLSNDETIDEVCSSLSKCINNCDSTCKP